MRYAGARPCGFGARRTARVAFCGPADVRTYRGVMAQLSEYAAATAWAVQHGESDLAIDIVATLGEGLFNRGEIGARSVDGCIPTSIRSPMPRRRRGAVLRSC